MLGSKEHLKYQYRNFIILSALPNKIFLDNYNNF